jgi:hypothetical protein
MPRTTSRTSAATASHRLARALTKETLVARKAFEAYLIISAVRRSVITTSVGMLRYSSATRRAAAASVEPSTTRSGFLKSSIAEPSRRNSGFDTTAAATLP